jgi:hypothetical protein
MDTTEGERNDMVKMPDASISQQMADTADPLIAFPHLLPTNSPSD